MKTQIKRFLLTLGFMTRIPVNVDLGEVKDEDRHKGFLYYPVVGLILGLCDMAVFLLVSLILPEVFGILFAMLANLCLTGAFHLDGLSDTADGIYSARTRERSFFMTGSSFSCVEDISPNLLFAKVRAPWESLRASSVPSVSISCRL